MTNEEKQVKNYNNLIDFLETNIIHNQSLCFGVVYNNFKTKQINEEDFLFIMTHYFLDTKGVE